MQETRIAMQREFLSFTCRGDSAQVEVLFEFYNPDQETRKLLVGFQSPSAYVEDSAASLPPITHLRIMSGGQLLPYRIMMAENEDGKLMELGQLNFTMVEGGIFVYLFEMSFAPGINVVQHSYRFRAGSSVMNDLDYSYILTTGAKWAGGKIADLTFQLDMGSNARYEIEDAFGSNANWAITGIGKISLLHPGFGEGPAVKAVCVMDGQLVVTVRDLVPNANINFIGRPSTLYIGGYADSEHYGERVSMAWTFQDPEKPGLTKDELRLLRNMVYARYGYTFKDVALRNTFEAFDWYIPDPNLKWEDIDLTLDERLFVERIKLKEAE